MRRHVPQYWTQKRRRPLRAAVIVAAPLALLAGLSPLGALNARAAAAPAPPSAPSSASAAPTPSGRVIVVLKNQLSSLPSDAAHRAQRGDETRVLQDNVVAAAGLDSSTVTHLSLGNAFIATVTSAQSASLLSDPDVGQVIPDAKIAVQSPGTAQETPPKASAQQSPGRVEQRPASVSQSANPYALCPSNPAKPLLEPEALGTIHAASSDGSPSAQQIVQGNGVTVAVMAEGIDPNAADFIRPDGKSAIVDYKDFSGEPATGNGTTYGEEIFGDASTIAAQGRVVHDLSDFVNPAHPLPPNCNIQIRGVAPGVNIVALKVLGTGSDQTYALASNVVQAINYAVNVDHVNIISESVGLFATPDSGADSAVELFNDEAVAAGVTVVAASGDAGANSTINSPAADPNVISAAGSTDQQLALQVGAVGTTLSNGHWINGNIGAFSSGGFTQEGTVPTLTAPGDAGWAACTFATNLPGCTSLVPDPSQPGTMEPSAIEEFAGTSQAAPMIAATAALVIEAYRNTHGGATPSPDLVRRILTSSATDLGAPSDEQGAGQVDALAAVRLAMSIGQRAGAPSAQGAGQLLASTSQIDNTGAPGATEQNSVTLTNPTDVPVSLAPSLRTLVPIAAPTTQTVTLDPDTDPSVPDPSGNKASYQELHFDVGKSVDHMSLSYAYSSYDPATGADGAAQVTVTLLAPDGSYVISSRPQGTTHPSNYGILDVNHPAAGRWTEIVSTVPASLSLFGISIPEPAYSGTVTVSVEQQRWIADGQVTPSRVRVPAHGDATVRAFTRLPSAGGDSALTLDLGSGRTIPIVQRVLLPMTARGATFSGGVTGGNGRSGQPAQSLNYAFDVTGAHRDLDVSTVFDAGVTPTAIAVLLIDPNGEVQSIENNENNTLSVDQAVQNYVADPQQGTWRMVIDVGNPVTGTELTSPFVGTIAYDRVKLGTSELPGSASDVIPAGKTTSVTLGVTNTGAQGLALYADPRTNTQETIPEDPGSTSLPLTEIPFLLSPFFEVPPQTTQVSGTVTSALPIQAQLTGPSAPIALTGPVIVGPAAQPGANGTATSTATLRQASGYITPGIWGLIPGQVGPFGPAGAPTGSAQLSMTIQTLGKATDISSSTGDPEFETTAQADAQVAGLALAPGANGTITLNITPTEPPGTVVHGYVNVVTSSVAAPLTKASLPVPADTDQVVDTIPYTYTVGASAS